MQCRRYVYLGCRSRICSYIKYKSTGDKADSCHEMKGKAPAIHAKRHCGANVGGKEAAHHSSCRVVAALCEQLADQHLVARNRRM